MHLRGVSCRCHPGRAALQQMPQQLGCRSSNGSLWCVPCDRVRGGHTRDVISLLYVASLTSHSACCSREIIYREKRFAHSRPVWLAGIPSPLSEIPSPLPPPWSSCCCQPVLLGATHQEVPALIAPGAHTALGEPIQKQQTAPLRPLSSWTVQLERQHWAVGALASHAAVSLGDCTCLHHGGVALEGGVLLSSRWHCTC